MARRCLLLGLLGVGLGFQVRVPPALQPKKLHLSSSRVHSSSKERPVSSSKSITTEESAAAAAAARAPVQAHEDWAHKEAGEAERVDWAKQVSS